MILVDTSIWIDHLRLHDERLARLLNDGQVLTHPFVIGELALGSPSNRNDLLSALHALAQTWVATDAEVLHLIEKEQLFGIGIGYIDAHLLAAVRLTPASVLWTRDKRLLAACTRLGVAFHATTH